MDFSIYLFLLILTGVAGVRTFRHLQCEHSPSYFAFSVFLAVKSEEDGVPAVPKAARVSFNAEQLKNSSKELLVTWHKLPSEFGEALLDLRIRLDIGIRLNGAIRWRKHFAAQLMWSTLRKGNVNCSSSACADSIQLGNVTTGHIKLTGIAHFGVEHILRLHFVDIYVNRTLGTLGKKGTMYAEGAFTPQGEHLGTCSADCFLITCSRKDR